ncbi:MAG: pilus assembly protein PilM [Synergistaceae bacterium]|nr:pilus assembly protein PilM [Synergistaceae bacterium]
MRLFHAIKPNLTAGLAIRNDSLGYIELDENGEDFREFRIPLEDGCVASNSIKDFNMLEKGFVQLIQETGKISVPIMLGVPSGDVIIRPLNFPNMSLDDIKSSLALNLEENFPFPSSEAVFDAVIIDTPSASRNRDNITVLAAAVKRNYIDNLIDIANKINIVLGAIEPANFAMLRAIPEDREGLCIFADRRNIVTTWEGHGIFFRTADNANSFNDIRSTLQFVETQYKRVKINKLILADVNLNITSSTDLEVVNFSSKFYKARGLAMRDPDDAYIMDLRPPEYIAFERRKNSLNLSRVALILLSSCFVILSMGTILFAISRMEIVQDAIDHNHEVIAELQAKRSEIMRNNAALSQNKAQTEQILNFLRDDIPILEVLNALEANAGTGIKLLDADFSRKESHFVVTINGTASDGTSLSLMSEGLQASGLFESVIIPGTSLSENNLVVFSIILTLKEDFYNAI